MYHSGISLRHGWWFILVQFSKPLQCVVFFVFVFVKWLFFSFFTSFTHFFLPPTPTSGDHQSVLYLYEFLFVFLRVRKIYLSLTYFWSAWCTAQGWTWDLWRLIYKIKESFSPTVSSKILDFHSPVMGSSFPYPVFQK